MSTVSSTDQDQYNILGSTGVHLEVVRGIIEQSSGDTESLVPGCLLEFATDGINLCFWDGLSTVGVAGVLLESVVTTTSAQPARVLVCGSVKNTQCYVYGGVGIKSQLTAVQWDLARKTSRITPQGFEYDAVGVISGTLLDEDDTVRNGIVVTLKDAEGTTIGTATTAAVTGAYSFTQVPVGTYYLNVPATSTYYATTSQAAVVTENATTTAAIVSLFKVGSIAGICTNDDTPAVELDGVSLTCMLVGSEGDPEYGPVLSGADGAYEFPAVRVGIAWKIIAVLAAHDTETVTDITVATDTETELDIVLDVTI
jgi:hypothetical protein